MNYNSPHLETIIFQQKQCFSSGVTRDEEFCKLHLRKLKNLLITYEQPILEALHKDLGKPSFEAYTSEIFLIKQEITHALKHLHSWKRQRSVRSPWYFFPASSFIYPEPYGVVLIIAPWNYPLQLLLVPLIGAIAAGNCVLLKPSEHAPHVAAVVHDIITHTFHKEHVTVISGDVGVTQQLLEYPLGYIFFTGSTQVGKQIMHAAAQHLTPVTLELGGKSPCIVHHDSSVSLAAKRIVWGKFLNAGQNCVAPDYILAHTDIKEALIQQMIIWIKQFYGDNPEQSSDYARIVNHHHFDRLKSLLTYGAIRHGGTYREDTRFIAPTIIDSIDPHSPLMTEEIFGPILPVISYSHIHEAINFIKQKPKPIALYLFSRNKQIHTLVIQNTSSGNICINDTMLQASSPHLPFGGIGNSGFGAYHGKTSFDTFSHYKSIVRRSYWFETSLRYPPYHTRIKQWLRSLF